MASKERKQGRVMPEGWAMGHWRVVNGSDAKRTEEITHLLEETFRSGTKSETMTSANF